MESKDRDVGGRPGPNSTIPEKRYFRIGEVADLVGVHAHVLRYWEKEVASIRPGKSSSNQRRYRRRDVEIFREIRRLLYAEGYTLSGAKRRLQTQGRPLTEMGEAQAPAGTPVAAVEKSLPDAGQKIQGALNAAKSKVAPVALNQQSEQMNLKFRVASAEEKLVRVKKGLNEIILLTGEQP